VVQGDPTKRNDFELASDFLLLNAPSRKDVETNYLVSAVGTSGGKNKSYGKTGVELRNYKCNEYNKLPEDQRKELIQWKKDKKKKNSNNNDGDNGDESGDKARIAALETPLNQRNV